MDPTNGGFVDAGWFGLALPVVAAVATLIAGYELNAVSRNEANANIARILHAGSAIIGIVGVWTFILCAGIFAVDRLYYRPRGDDFVAMFFNPYCVTGHITAVAQLFGGLALPAELGVLIALVVKRHRKHPRTMAAAWVSCAVFALSASWFWPWYWGVLRQLA